MVFGKFQDAGVLTYEILNMIKMCNPIFDAFHFSEEMEDDRLLAYAVIGTVEEYLQETDEKKTVMHGLQSTTKIIG